MNDISYIKYVWGLETASFTLNNSDQKKEPKYLKHQLQKGCWSMLQCFALLSVPYLTHVPSFQIPVPPSHYPCSIPILKVQLKCCLLQEAFPDLHKTSKSIPPSSAPLFIMQLLKLYFVSGKYRRLETAMLSMLCLSI